MREGAEAELAAQKASKEEEEALASEREAMLKKLQAKEALAQVRSSGSIKALLS